MLENNRFVNRLKAQVEENPIVALGVGAACATALSKLLDASTSRANAKAWAKEVDRRDRNSRKSR